MIDSHVHSEYSADGHMPIEVACKSAISKGLQGLCITDHLDIDYPKQLGATDTTPDFALFPDFTDIYNDINKCQYKYSDKMKLLYGIEVGIQPHVLNKTVNIVNSHEFDFILMSTHVIDEIDISYSQFYNNITIKQACEKYFEKLVFAMNAYDNYDSLAHIDYIRRYFPKYELNENGMKIKELLYNDYADYLDAILKKLAYDGKALELNTGGIRYNIYPQFTDSIIFKRFKELGGEYVTLGSDAHLPENIGDGFDSACDFLKECGFKNTTYFSKRKAVELAI